MVVISDSEFFERLNAVIGKGWLPLPETPGYGGTGGPGLFLESQIGIDPGNRDGPDTGVWELKYHGGSAPITLFHLTPLPKGNMHNIVNGYGWDDGKGCTSFRHTIWGTSPRGFYVVNNSGRIIVRNKDHGDRPETIASPYWGHDSLINAFVYKLRRLAVVRGKKRKGHVKYESARLYWEPNTTGLIDAIEQGIIAIDFDARTTTTGKGLRDHGTKFRIKLDDLHYLYSKNKHLDA